MRSKLSSLYTHCQIHGNALVGIIFIARVETDFVVNFSTFNTKFALNAQSSKAYQMLHSNTDVYTNGIL